MSQREKNSKGEDGDEDDGNKEDDEEGETNDKRKEAYESDEEEEGPKKEETKITYDPSDADSLCNTAVEMLQRLKAIEGSMASVKEQLRMNGL